MTNDMMGVQDQLHLMVHRNGKLVDERISILPFGIRTKWIHFWQYFGFYKQYMDDLVVNAGKAAVANLLATNSGPLCFGYVGIGNGTTAAAATQTDLLGATKIRQAADTIERVTTNVANDTYQATTIFDIESTIAITESGVFDASSSGNMLCRQVFNPINLESGDQVTLVWKIVIS